ncbi:MAG: hypothetical protein EBY22_10935 [Gammaproteobacteria bacterium]|nr:hypothetical protein [Gammaproteobacteria bacterium]
MENPTSILTVDLITHKEKFIALLGIFQNVNSKLETEIKNETDKQIAFLNELILKVNEEQRYMICMFLKYPNGIVIPYGYPAFASHETDAIVNHVVHCFAMMTRGGMPVAYENNFFTDDKLLCLAVSAVCDMQMLQRALAEAEENAVKH